MFVENYFFSGSRFSALGGVSQELGCSGGDRKCRSKKSESPPWVCEKCAKKHPPNMGCGEGEVVRSNDIEDDYVRNTRDIDDILDSDSHIHYSPQEALGCDKCKEGQRRKRRKAAEEAARRKGSGTALYTPYEMHGIRVSNLGRISRIGVMNLGHTHRIGQGAGATEYLCPISPATSYDPTLNCMRDARGNAICSDGTRFPPGCPHTPPDQYFTPGVTPDAINAQGMIEGQQPPPRAAGSAPAPAAAPGTPVAASGTSPVTVAVAGAGALGLGVLLFSLFK